MKFDLEDENKKLRNELCEEREKLSKQKKHFTNKVIDLENKVSDLEFVNAEQSINLKILEEELLNKNVGNRRHESYAKTSVGSVSESTSPSCFASHTSSISGINKYISVLAKAKDDVVNYKKESTRLQSELESYRKKLSSRDREIELLKSDLEQAKQIEDKKCCTCHDNDSYASLEDAKTELRQNEKRIHFRSSQDGKGVRDGKPTDIRESTFSRNKRFSKDASVQVNEFESVMKTRLDEYIRKAQDIIRGEDSYNCQAKHSVEEERDYYCREFHRLTDKVLHAIHFSDRDSLTRCPFEVLDGIRSEINRLRARIEELKVTGRTGKSCTACCSTSARHLEERVKCLEGKESELTFINNKLANKLRKLEEQCHDYKEKIKGLNEESGQQKSVYSRLRAMQDDSERSLFNLQDSLRKCDSELSCALGKICRLEEDNKRLKRELAGLENEKHCLKKNLVLLDREKDSIGIRLDEKTELVVRLEKDLAGKKKRVSDLENSLSKLEESSKILQNINFKAEESSRHAKKTYSTMQQQLQHLQVSNSALIEENRRLQDNLSAAVKDCFQSNNQLQSARAEADELKVRLQSYVSEVRRIEDILQIKEDERRCMLEQLKGLNIEYSSNNSKSRTVDNPDCVSFDKLSDSVQYHNYDPFEEG